jgi:hypothetical protein
MEGVTLPAAQLAYCTNVHPGETLARTKAMLEQHAVRVRELTAPNGTLGIGLWLSAQSARELLLEADGVARFREWLNARALAVRTINGFPYGDFHGETVKTRVYHPHWADPNRSLFTLDLAKILAQLVTPGTRTASISTVPVGWRPDFSNEGCGASVGLAASQLEWMSGKLAELELEGAALFDSVTNALKLLGDQHLARVQRAAGRRFRIDDWEQSVSRKLATLGSISERLEARQSQYRSELLEWIIIALIAFEIVQALW